MLPLCLLEAKIEDLIQDWMKFFLLVAWFITKRHFRIFIRMLNSIEASKHRVWFLCF